MLALKAQYGTATPRIQKSIDTAGLDNFVVEFDVKTVGEPEQDGRWYHYFRLAQDNDPNMTDQHLSATDPVWAGTTNGEWMRVKAFFDLNNNIITVYEKTSADGEWIVDDIVQGIIKDDAGIVDLTFYVPARQDNAGYLDNIEIYTARKYVNGAYTNADGENVYLEPTMLDGASVRFADPAGIRFKGFVNKEYIKGLQHVYGEENVEYGVVIAPYDYVTYDTESKTYNFTVEELEAGKGCILIKAETLAAETEEYYEFNCAIVDIKEKNYGRDYAARTYIEITKADETTEYVYSDFDSRDNVRSLADVAARALATGIYSGAKQQQLEKYSVGIEPLSTGSDLRVMSMNILSERADVSDDYANVKERAQLLKKTIEGYKPAVVGLQEVTKNWLKAINENSETKLSADYEVIQGTYKGSWGGFIPTTETNETAIVYDKTQVEVVTGTYGTYTNNYGYITFEQDDKDHTTTWAAMQTKNGEKFLFINAHPSYYKPGEDTNGVLAQQWTQLVEFIATLKGTYTDFGIILVGDFNTGYSQDEYKQAAAAGLLDGQDAVLAGLCQGGFTCDTMHSVGKHESDLYAAHGGSDAFDHIFVDTNTSAQFRKFSVVVDDDVINMSDHYPLYADIVLNPEQ